MCRARDGGAGEGSGGKDAAGHRGVGEMELEISQGRVVVETENCQAKASGLCPKDWSPGGAPRRSPSDTVVGTGEWAPAALLPCRRQPGRSGEHVRSSPSGAPEGRRCPSPDPLGAARTRGHSSEAGAAHPPGEGGARSGQVKLARNPQS